MFGKKQSQVPPSLTLDDAARFALQSFDRRWEEGKRTRPSHFPDGRPYEPDPLIEGVRAAYWRACHETDPDRDPDISGITLLMMVLSELATTKPTMTIMQATPTIRQSMLARGAEVDERAVSAFALYLIEYWQATGAFDEYIKGLDGKTEEQLRQMP